MTDIRLVVHDIRSTHNVGSLLRTCEGIGVSHVYFTGYTPYPALSEDERLPHIANKLTKQIQKTALGAESMVEWSHADITDVFSVLRSDAYPIIALEQSADSIPIQQYTPPDKVALLLGREVEGIDPDILKLCDGSIEIPMFGMKESFNVVQAAAMALYKLRFG